ncbi:AMP-binding enzyme [Pseudooceanicola batsensis HTCC2597]|uniref:AMP-binding enzyme n=1 Tax=Pseudooceanicola batsensis (strain ATCC BAA-863 / DSM 15984 / KCTC 12145 / HTCC2597) TaxID=252305 RepID=A3TZ82_PSEBH|nr:long-chain fatty acid--CoA ligase [Pseudooceanicola batsensis]EAQ02900.1 AMP-binding enzyme [Pseudooceanicola batsensis HTCC2597]
MEMSRVDTSQYLSFDGHETITSLWADRCARYGDRVAHREKELGIWQAYSWRDYYDCARKIGRALMALGVKKGEPVLILAEDRREWLYIDLASASIGAIPAGVYTTDSAAQLAYLANDSGARVLFVENDEQLDKYLEARDRMEGIQKVVVMEREGLASFSDPKVMFLDELYAMGETEETREPGLFEEAIKAVRPEDPRMLIYTSGTTGPPKGAMITHRNMIFQMRSGSECLEFLESDNLLCFLPLCHVLERIVSVEAPIANGCIVNFAESPETVFDNLQEVSPDSFSGVPRIWEKIYSRVMILRSEAGPIGARAFDWALAVGHRYAQAENPGAGLRLAHAVADFTVLANLRRMLGLANARRVTSGAAPISPDLIHWFGALGVPLIEGYGMTETAGIATVNTVEDNRIGTVGTAIPGVEMRIDETGELLIGGPCVFGGYWNKPEKTAETMTEDGWLRTGDVGRIGNDGALTITGRLKDIIITAGGKNITPAEIESKLKFSPYVSDAVVIGDRRKYLTCLIMIDQENVEKFAQDRQIPFSDFASLTRAPEVRDLIGGVVAEANRQFAQVEQIKDFRLIDILLTAEDEELTPTMKLKRNFVNQRHAALIDEMY